VKVILRKDVAALGDTGEVVAVKNGYANNYLIPQGIAIRATEGTLKALETEKKQQAKRSSYCASMPAKLPGTLSS